MFYDLGVKWLQETNFLWIWAKSSKYLVLDKKLGSRVEGLKKIDGRYHFLKILVSLEDFRLFLKEMK